MARRHSPIAPPVDISDFVDHIDDIVKLIGIDHVGISFDFDDGVDGWNDESETLRHQHEVERVAGQRGVEDRSLDAIPEATISRADPPR